MRLLFDNTRFRRTPYPIGLAKPIFDEANYADFIAGFPSDEMIRRYPFQSQTGGYKKYSLNERHRDYFEYLEARPLWYAFYLSIKKPQWVPFIFSMLKAHHVDVPGSEDPTAQWSSRFEFAAMPADGGYIAPHNDIPSKAVTLIFSMQAEGDWEPAWGGGTDVLVPRAGVTPKSYVTPLDQFQVVASFPYQPNQCVLFVRSEHSWHSVGPMTGPPGPLRRTLTLNIEHAP